MKFALVVPRHPAVDALGVFREPLQVTRYALEALGHECLATRAVNNPGYRTIVFGSALVDVAAPPPAGSILYNMEQPINLEPIMAGLAPFLPGYTVWEYAGSNIGFWREHGVDAIHVPIGHMPQMERIPVLREEERDIDVLFYGWINPRRAHVLDELRSRHPGLNVASFSDKFGEERDAIIARSKIVLNVHFHEPPPDEYGMFEIVRIGYLLGNAVMVVSELSKEAKTFEEALAFERYDRLANLCAAYVAQPKARERRAEWGRSIMRSMPATTYIETALTATSKRTDQIP